MPLTFSGRLVAPGGLEHPSLIDIAVGLSRQPRFAGQGQRWWSVLDHTLFCDELVKQNKLYSDFLNECRLAVLLHDAHEAITADVPTDVKTEEFKAQQKILDVVIQDAFFPGGRFRYIDRGYSSVVKRIDRRALCAEAQVIGPPVSKERILELFGSTDELWDDVGLLQELYDGLLYGISPCQMNQSEHPAVKEYLRRMMELL